MKDKVLLPLTQPQKNIWLTQCIYDGDPMFNIGGMVNIPGMIDVDRLKQSILLFVNRHDSFRIRLVNEDDIKQYFTDARPEPVELIDFSCDEFP